MNIRKGYKQTEIGVIPEDWDVYSLDQVTEAIVGGGTPSKTEKSYWENGNIYWVTPSEFTKNQSNYLDSSLEKITEKGLKNSSATLLSPGTVIMSSRATIGECKISSVPMTTNQGFISFECAEKLHNVYLLYLLRQLKNRVLTLSSGSTFLEVSRKTMRGFKIQLPPLEEQKKIAAILNTVDQKIDVIDTRIEETETLKKGLMQKLLSEGIGHTEFKDSEIGRIPVGWEIVKVSDITVSHKQGYYTKEKYTQDGIYLIRITDLMNPKISYQNMPKLTIPENDYKLFKVSQGDFLFARSGAIGRYGIVYEKKPAIFASYLIRFVFDKTKVLNEFFGYFYETKTAINQLLSITQGSSNININANNIKAITVPLPSLEEQKQITKILSTTDDKLETLRAKKESFETLKQGLMQKLLTGEVRVQS